MRSVSGNAAALPAQARNAAAPGTPRRGTAYCTTTLFLCRVGFVRVDDARDERMAHYVLGAELRGGDAAHPVEEAAPLDPAALLAPGGGDLRDGALHPGL